MQIPDPIYKLTPRELETLRLIVHGKTDIEISRELRVTYHTINAYRKSLLHKLGANNVASLVRIAIEKNIVKLGASREGEGV